MTIGGVFGGYSGAYDFAKANPKSSTLDALSDPVYMNNALNATRDGMASGALVSGAQAIIAPQFEGILVGAKVTQALRPSLAAGFAAGTLTLGQTLYENMASHKSPSNNLLQKTAISMVTTAVSTGIANKIIPAGSGRPPGVFTNNVNFGTKTITYL